MNVSLNGPDREHLRRKPRLNVAAFCFLSLMLRYGRLLSDTYIALLDQGAKKVF